MRSIIIMLLYSITNWSCGRITDSYVVCPTITWRVRNSRRGLTMRFAFVISQCDVRACVQFKRGECKISADVSTAG